MMKEIKIEHFIKSKKYLGESPRVTRLRIFNPANIIIVTRFVECKHNQLTIHDEASGRC